MVHRITCESVTIFTQCINKESISFTLKAASPSSTSTASDPLNLLIHFQVGTKIPSFDRKFSHMLKECDNLKVRLICFRRWISSGTSNTKEGFEMLVTSDTIEHALTHKIIFICSIRYRRKKFVSHARRRINSTQVAQSIMFPFLSL